MEDPILLVSAVNKSITKGKLIPITQTALLFLMLIVTGLYTGPIFQA